MALEENNDFSQFVGTWTDEEADEFERNTAEFRMVVPPFFTNLERPTIVCLCGSTQFYDVFSTLNLEETLAGKIVLSIASDRKTEDEIFAGLTSAELKEAKQKLGLLHFQKIDLVDEILVVNVDGYVGESTTREILYARENHKTIRWLEPENIPVRLKELL
jgi:hypothetical protein